ncbi:hypothetical protein INT48_009185 [Thamnidium elegans]|uniref:Uncharacterized protein n=1 Tax=Thamnidium elegans TaxID=101142 RepID=A0A8H7VX62_9FUNG|nr:hypothetical protein INT48_009185 [Thamnidium elegans]
MFTNMVRTDGYGIDFILAGPERQSNKLPNLDVNDFTPEGINERFHLWGVDPGQINIFTASDGHDTDPHQLRKYPTAEYYTRAGLKKTNLHILNYKNADLQFQEAEQRITTHKTANLERFLEYVHSVLNNLDILLQFYDHRFTALRFLNYIGRQRADAEMTCSNCSGNNTEDVRIDDVSLFGVLHCLNQSCNTLWQRDINSSRNMHSISWNVIMNHEVPSGFQRQ